MHYHRTAFATAAVCSPDAGNHEALLRFFEEWPERLGAVALRGYDERDIEAPVEAIF